MRRNALCETEDETCLALQRDDDDDDDASLGLNELVFSALGTPINDTLWILTNYHTNGKV